MRLLTRTSLTLTMSFITETEILNSVYRLLGAKIGKRCRISTLSITEWDLVEIGDDCVIGVSTHWLMAVRMLSVWQHMCAVGHCASCAI